MLQSTGQLCASIEAYFTVRRTDCVIIYDESQRSESNAALHEDNIHKGVGGSHPNRILSCTCFCGRREEAVNSQGCVRTIKQTLQFGSCF